MCVGLRSYVQARVLSLGGEIGRVCDPTGAPAGPIRAWPGGLAVARYAIHMNNNSSTDMDTMHMTSRRNTSGGTNTRMAGGDRGRQVRHRVNLTPLVRL